MMMRALLPATLVLLAAGSAHAAAPDCKAVQTPDQRRDADTLRRIEGEWLAAELRGNTRFLDCLLDPGYAVVVSKDNTVRSKADLLARVAAHGNDTPDVPPLTTTVVVDGDFATAYSVLKGTKKNGEPYESRYVDSYFFRDGAWHASGGVDL
jgi:ketosteroid isomerase-like protein